MDETKAVITLTKAALEFIYSDRSIDEAWSDYEESALELYDNESDQSADEFLDQARLIFHDSVDARLKELKKHSRFTDNAVAKPEKTPTEHSQTGAEIAAAVIAVWSATPTIPSTAISNSSAKHFPRSRRQSSKVPLVQKYCLTPFSH
jgi:hypothetical protein